MFDEFKNAFQRQNNAHVQLIIINVIVFVVLAVLMVFSRILNFENVFTLIHSQLAIPPIFSDFIIKPWTIITYAFVHALNPDNIFHILFNMIALYWFGRLFVEYLGSDKLVALYVLGAIAGAILYLISFNTIPYFVAQAPMISGMVGASAAINAIVVAAAVLLPDYTFYLLFVGPVKIKYIAAITVFISFLGTVGFSNSGGNIAHLGGALMGYVYIKQLQKGNNLGSFVTFIQDWFRGSMKSKPKVKVTYRNSDSSFAKSSKGSRASQEEIDAILDKISDKGYESLTKEEKEKLFNASKK
jgi:membrane associated rhomboid family serine protease